MANPLIWGSNGWGLSIEIIKSLVIYAKNFPDIEYFDESVKKTYNDLYRMKMESLEDCLYSLHHFLTNFYIIIPCSTCSEDTKKYIQTHRFPYEKRTEWLKWIYNFKDYVNKKIGKKTNIPYETFIKKIRMTSSSISAYQLFDLILIMSRNIESLYDIDDFTSLELKLFNDKLRIFFISLSNLCFTSNELMTVAPFISFKDYSIKTSPTPDLFKYIYNKAKEYEIETKGKLHIKNTGIESYYADKKKYVPIMFGKTLENSWKKYSYIL